MKNLSILIIGFLLFSSCQLDTSEEPNKYDTLNLSLNRKELTKLFKGQELYSIKGIKTNFNQLTARVRSIPNKKEYVFLIELKDTYFNGSNHFVLNSDKNFYTAYKSLATYIENKKLIWPRTMLYNVQFKDKIQKQFVYIDIPHKESIEFNGNRFLQKASYSQVSKKLELEESEILNPFNLACFDYSYPSLIVLKKYMAQTKIKLQSVEGIKIIPNPITNKMEFVIDPSYITYKKQGIRFENFIKSINSIKPVSEKLLALEERNFENFQKEKLNKNLEIIELKGNITLTEDLHINNKRLLIDEGTSIKLLNDSKIIIIGGEVHGKGTENNPIKINGSQFNAVFMNNISNSTLNYVEFDNLSNWVDSCKSIPSAVTVYNSEATFNHCTFSNNKRGDDILNCFQSKFKLNNCHFENVLSDALDSDFSEGQVLNTSFNIIGNDGVDCSGSHVVVDNCVFIKVEDKAISAGEATSINVKNNTIKKCGIGYVSKDGSTLKISNDTEIIHNDLDFAIFFKKNFYSPPVLHFDNSLSSYTYLIQKGTKIISNDTPDSVVLLEDVESKLYGKEYGKASKR